METKHEGKVTEFLKSMKRLNKFNKLKPDNTSDNWFSLKLKVSSYNELNLMVSDLLKASIILLNNDARDTSIIKDSVNVMTLLEIALQLLPEGEMELLDDLHEIYLESDAVMK